MTNAMPSLQMMIKLSYGWRPFEGSFYLNHRGQIVRWDEEKAEHAKKLVAQELERLCVSFEAAKAAGYRRYILFLHYPPTSILEEERRQKLPAQGDHNKKRPPTAQLSKQPTGVNYAKTRATTSFSGTNGSDQ